MFNKELIAKSGNIKTLADKLLEESKIISILERFGDTEVAGSYKFNLMMHGDIDIYVFNPKFNREKALEVFNAIVLKTTFNSYMFGDWVNFDREEFPKGSYIGMKIKKEGVKFKIDIWLMHQESEKTLKYQRMLSNLSMKDRGIILKFKEYRNKYNLDLSSAIIYEAVLEKKIDTITKLKEFINNRIHRSLK